MMKKSCSTLSLITSKYCRLTACLECGVVNLNLPGRISLQFEIDQFIEIAREFNRAVQTLKTHKTGQRSGNVVDIKRMH